MSNALLALPPLLAFAGGLALPTVITRFSPDDGAVGIAAPSRHRALITAVLVVVITETGLVAMLALDHTSGLDGLLHGDPTPALRLWMQLTMGSAAAFFLLLGLLVHIWAPPAYEWTHEAIARLTEQARGSHQYRPGYISAQSAAAGRHRR